MKAHRIIIKAFRAVDEPASCLEYLRGHLAVLQRFKIAHITSNTVEWAKIPTTIAFTIESLTDGAMIGGARLQVFDYRTELPVEGAIGGHDANIFPAVNLWAQEGLAEFCGLWNTREAIKIGIGSIFIARIGVAIASQLKVKHLLALSAPTTVKTTKRVGFQVEESLGNKGTFYYPKIDMVATLFRHSEILTLDHAEAEDRDLIIEMRERQHFVKQQVMIAQPCEIEFNLEVKNLEKSNFYHLIDQVK